MHDVERHRETFARQLRMHIDMRAVEHQLALMQRAALDETQRRLFAGIAADSLVVAFEIVAAVARTEVTARQKRKVVIVRDAVNKGARPAIAETQILLGGPDVGAQEHRAAALGKHDRLRSKAALYFARLPPRQAIHQQVGQERAVVVEPPQPACRLVDAGGIARVKIERSQRLDAFGQRTALGGRIVDHQRHQAGSLAKAASSCS